MDNQPVICSSCGAMIKPGAKFCVKCGQSVIYPPPVSASAPIPAPTPPVPPPLTAPTSPPVPPAQPASSPPPLQTPVVPPLQSIPPAAFQSGEQVLTVVGMISRKTGVFSAVVYHMVVTNARLIFALQTKEMQMADINAAREHAKIEGKKWLGQIGAQMSTRSGEKYMGWSPDAILLENPQNFMIPLNELKVIETYTGDFDDNAPDTMVVKTMSDKIQFTISNAMGVNRQLKQVLGNRVK